MWIMTTGGVLMPALRPPDTVAPGDAQVLQVRARAREHLERFRDGYCNSSVPGVVHGGLGPTYELRNTDYQCRANVSLQDLSVGVLKLLSEIDYEHFKHLTEVHYQDKKLHSAYISIWSALNRAYAPELPRSLRTAVRDAGGRFTGHSGGYLKAPGPGEQPTFLRPEPGAPGSQQAPIFWPSPHRDRPLEEALLAEESEVIEEPGSEFAWYEDAQRGLEMEPNPVQDLGDEEDATEYETPEDLIEEALDLEFDDPGASLLSRYAAEIQAAIVVAQAREIAARSGTVIDGEVVSEVAG